MRQRPKLNSPVARYVRSGCPRLTLAQTVGEALLELRATRPVDRVLYLYVVDSEGAARGGCSDQNVVVERS
jgi:hypothetical protein